MLDGASAAQLRLTFSVLGLILNMAKPAALISLLSSAMAPAKYLPLS